MKKFRIITIGLLSLVGLLFIIIVCLYIYGFHISKPSYDEQYFTQEYLDKYSSLPETYNHWLNAFISGDIEYVQEVRGRKLAERELKLFKPYEGKRPKIVKIESVRFSAYIVTDNNWGLFFEEVNGRWVFTPEDWGANVRGFFKLLYSGTNKMRKSY